VRWRPSRLERAGYERAVASKLAAADRDRPAPGDRLLEPRLLAETPGASPLGTRPPRRQKSPAVPSPLGYIPSPSSGSIQLGPLAIHLYGLTLLVAILLCVWLTIVRWRAAGGDSDSSSGSRSGVSPSGSWGRAPTTTSLLGRGAHAEVAGVFEIWKGGLGIWGGILLGTLAGS